MLRKINSSKWVPSSPRIGIKINMQRPPSNDERSPGSDHLVWPHHPRQPPPPPQVVRATKMVQPVVDDYHGFSTKDLASWAVDLENLGQEKLTLNPCRTLWGRKTTNQPFQGRLPSSKRTWASNWKIHPSLIGDIHLHSWLDFPRVGAQPPSPCCILRWWHSESQLTWWGPIAALFEKKYQST